MKDLVDLLTTVRRKRLLGTLVLGRGRSSFEIFLEDDAVYLDGPLMRKIDLRGFSEVDGLAERIQDSTIDSLVLALDGGGDAIFPELLLSRSLVSEEEFKSLVRCHLEEELFERLLENGESFRFQEGHVPDTLIGRSSVAVRFPLKLEPFLEFIDKRLEQLGQIRQLIPSMDEVFVLSEKGMANKQASNLGFGFRKILDLLDGFRTLRSTVDDGFLFRFYVERQVAELLVEGWIRKTIIPEIQGVDPTRLSPEDARRYVPYFKNAIKYGTDELRAREGYANLAERLGKIDEAIIQYNFIGDTLYQMRRRGLAVRAYQKALALRPGDQLVTEKVLRIFEDNAEEALERGKFAEATTLYRKALEFAPHHIGIFERLVDLYLSKGKTAEVADLCDQAAAISRDQASPDFAMTIFSGVIETAGCEPVFQKKLINLYLDFDMKREAADEMERLARHYVDGRQSTQAVDLIEKTLRIDPSRRELRKLARSAGRVRKRKQHSVSVKVIHATFLLLLLLGVAYQIWALIGFRRVSGEQYLIYDLPDVSAQTAENEYGVHETSRETKLRALAAEARAYGKRYPYSIFTAQARKLASQYEASAAQIERGRNHIKKKLLEDGRRLFVQGRDADAMETLKPLLDLGPEDVWRTQAEAEIARFREYEGQAGKLREMAEQAIATGEYKAAHKLVSKLLDEFPNAKSAHDVRFPIEIVIVPRHLESELRHVPKLVKLGPRDSRKYRLETQGFEPLTVYVSPGEHPKQPIYLNQTPVWKRKIASPGPHPLRLAGHHILLMDETGSLEAIRVHDGKTMWRYETSDLVRPTGPILVRKPHFFLPLNNRTIMKFRVNGQGQPEDVIELDSFIQTPLVGHEHRDIVLFGTSRQSIALWHPTQRAVELVPMQENARRISPCGKRSVLALGESGAVYRVDLIDGSVTWKSRFTGRFSKEPMLVGDEDTGTVLLETENSEFVALEAASGNIQWRQPKPTGTRVTALLRESERVLLVEGGTFVLELDPRTKKRQNIWAVDPLRPGFTDIVELGVGLGLFCPDGSFMIADPKTLVPIWRYGVEGVTFRSAVYNGSFLTLLGESGELHSFLYLPE